MALVQTMDNEQVDGGNDAEPRPEAARAAQGPPHTGRVARQLARRRRREQLGGILIAVLGIVVLVVAFLALRSPRHPGSAAGTDTRVSIPAEAGSVPGRAAPSVSSSVSSSSSPAGPAHSSPPAVADTPVVVVNQSGTADLAHQAAATLRRGGWHVSAVQETFNNDVMTTTAYYDPSVPGAEQAAEALHRQFPGIHRVAERFTPVPGGDSLPPGPVVVVLTDDYTS